MDTVNCFSYFAAVMTVGGMLRNRAAFAQDVQQHLAINPSDLDPLMNTTLPNDNLEVSQEMFMVNLNREHVTYICVHEL